MKVTIWKGGTYGIRISSSDMHHFAKDWNDVEIEIQGQITVYPLRHTFWSTCPEFRGGVIAEWVRTQGLTSWASGSPPTVQLTPLGGKRFRLSH
jgi:hypothetical protein